MSKNRATLRLYEAYHTDPPHITDASITDSSKSRLVCADDSTGDKVIVTGDHFKYRGGILDEGTITKVTVQTADGLKSFEASLLRIDAGTIGGDDIMEFVLNLLPRTSRALFERLAPTSPIL